MDFLCLHSDERCRSGKLFSEKPLRPQCVLSEVLERDQLAPDGIEQISHRNSAALAITLVFPSTRRQ